MASIKKDNLKKELQLALEEIGTISPKFDKKVNAWVFEHSLYPVRCAEATPQKVIENYPKYLEVFIEHRMQGRIDEVNARKTKGKGGARAGAGRPKGTIKSPTKQIRLPVDIADWLKTPGTLDHLRFLMESYPSSSGKHLRC